MKNKKIESSKKVGQMPLIVLILIGLLLSYFSFITFQSGFRSIDDLKKYIGVLTKKGEITQASGSGEDRSEKELFYIYLSGVDQRFTSYNMDERYGDLDRALNVGDEVMVYYEEPGELYQIENGGNVVLDISEKQLRGKIFGTLALLGAIFVFQYGIRGHLRNWKNIKT